MKLRIATRASRLSLVQVDVVVERLRRVVPNLEVELVKVKTRGDIHQDKPLYAIGGKGLFEKEVNKAVLDGRADIAVHSMKDLPSQIDPRLEILMVPPREPPNDVFLSRAGDLDPFRLPENTVVGTSSTRRKALILHYNPRARVEPIRGNVDTRLKKLETQGYDAIVLAEAGLIRLGVRREYKRLPLDSFPPAPCQGLLAVVGLRDDSRLHKILGQASDPIALREAMAERAFLEAAGGGCHVPLGGVSVHWANRLVFIAAILSSNGEKAFWIKLRGDVQAPEKLGREAGEAIQSAMDRVLG